MAGCNLAAVTLPVLMIVISLTVVSYADDQILAATYGLAGCLGVDVGNLTDLRTRGCVVTDNNMTSARSALQMKGVCGLTSEISAADALPVTFSAPVQKRSIEPSYFEFQLNTGDVVHALCATAGPANEANEYQTIATIGHFGDGWADTVFPVKVSIVGDLLFQDGSSAKGLSFDIRPENRFATGTPFMVQAQLQRFSTQGESSWGWKAGQYPNHCRHLFGSSVSHRVRVVLNGGATLDGVQSFLPNQTSVFELLDSNGSALSAMVLGIADLGSSKQPSSGGAYVDDGDNFFDVCLDQSQGDLSHIAQIRMPCDQVQLVLPKGRPVCKDHTIDVEDLRA